MRELVIGREEAHQRLDKYLQKYFENASAGFLYKMMRKKNIVRNGKKVQGKEILCEGDVIRVFFSDETFAAMRGGERALGLYEKLAELEDKDVDVIYEDADILVINKPVGMLSQKAKEGDVSLVEEVMAYTLASGRLTDEQLRTYKPAVCNRLDRNTSGIVIAGVSLYGLQHMSALLRERGLDKYYWCLVCGEVKESALIRGYLKKDEASNKVEVLRSEREGADPIETEYHPLKTNGRVTLLSVKLITGKSHQIRAHLASIGHPVVGDYKYGTETVNRRFCSKYGVRSQMLHARTVKVPGYPEWTAPLPELFARVLEAEGLGGM